jgi:hypothetical protein
MARRFTLSVALTVLAAGVAGAESGPTLLEGRLLAEPVTGVYDPTTREVELSWKGQTLRGVAADAYVAHPVLTFDLELWGEEPAAGAAGRLTDLRPSGEGGAAVGPRAIRLGLLRHTLHLTGRFTVDGQLQGSLRAAQPSAESYHAAACEHRPTPRRTALGERPPQAKGPAHRTLLAAAEDEGFARALTAYMEAWDAERALGLVSLEDLGRERDCARHRFRDLARAGELERSELTRSANEARFQLLARESNQRALLWGPGGERTRSYADQVAQLSWLAKNASTAQRRLLAAEAANLLRGRAEAEEERYRAREWKELDALVFAGETSK